MRTVLVLNKDELHTLTTEGVDIQVGASVVTLQVEQNGFRPSVGPRRRVAVVEQQSKRRIGTRRRKESQAADPTVAARPPKRRRTFALAFKTEAVEMVDRIGLKKAARRLKIDSRTLHNWKNGRGMVRGGTNGR